ncbi:putative exonuclease [Nitratireductor aquibiodomus RA22]|uniref:Putative exonuclease n=1 Tax=Nitratireductor aquibiodomus RA22 TaxID=1189611 RepID=I5BSR9_9HYPH|nr:exonuclease domain-containing protein [Nitratireductor aquibiodomus]EIM72621.1 putative exonuclease [Nitratireductor aquibiodomus RA22]
MVERASAVIFDCEYLVSEGAQARYWCGPYDPDPVVVQIGAVRLILENDFAIAGEFEAIITPVDRYGRPFDLAQTFVDLTGITRERIAQQGRSLPDVLAALCKFSGKGGLWSWGKDEFNLMAISCYIAGIEPPIAAHRFDNACKLLLKAGMPYDDIRKTRSGHLPHYFNLPHAGPGRHDGLEDARAVARVLQHLLRERRLTAESFKRL